MSDREPIVIRTSGSGGWAVAVILLVAVIAGGFFLFEAGYLGNHDVDIGVTLPKIEPPAPVTR
ncbi:Hypothetical protein RG1141_PA05490 (plasmid) [Neorhizobium galegae bv. officinalis bv. officinalis str. HAMBI 1141]|uniref:Uncharacterized protein n=1 Tax=Neorhizobium galegae bv. officinalis bv. officinalis str. HAMBI 1141 TaxID=1028801 RepID=A0A068TH32_NEOGA|nr:MULTISPECIES: hypothetical protein [Neorhizobium]MCJ9670573.1 hypothetical protein [Neorhizobium sp. SHOUNA12B]MCJ9747127.1 hypothetical protein [Neorhizobium sp. SHOUNA12A]MCJ9751220.1 hypothetical protein [Neorhizobium sp. BETTINA12A]CDN57384.1 Hypothetical protein RG1141_PA05490 [Neorhizobium galegae bv. officinalis bv. officinalis str. HAMBI 1141]